MPKPKVHLVSCTSEQHPCQTDYEYCHSTECGYVRELVNSHIGMVTCKLCLWKIDRWRNA